MKQTSVIAGVAFALGADTPWVQDIPSTVERRVAVVHLGDLAMHVEDTPPETLRALSETFAELAAWRQRQVDADEGLPMVAAEQGGDLR